MKIQEIERGNDRVLFDVEFDNEEQQDFILGDLCQEEGFHHDQMRIHPDGELYFHHKYPMCYSIAKSIFDGRGMANWN